MTSYSQFQEDLLVLKHLPLPPKGVFCEVGAYDGVASSNTLGFEREGWSGLCIEADPVMAEACRKNRRCITLSNAVGFDEGVQTFWVNPADRGTSSLIPHTGWQSIRVPVRRLASILRELALTEVDLLSIDTEGTELDVWRSLDPLRPGIVIVEFWTQPSPPRDKEIVARMAKDGYKEVHRTEANLIFTRV